MTGPIVHENLRTPGKRRAPQRHARRLAAVAGSYPSPNYSSRNGTKVTGVCIHTAEGPTDANSLGAYFAQPKVQASSHEGADESKRIRYVDYSFEAWTLRNGNPWTDNLEMCAHAAWSRAEWLAHPGMLQLAAEWVAERCHARGVPPVRRTVADLQAGRRDGYFAHWDYTLATGDGSHWDVGKDFPWDVFGGLVQAAYHGTPTQEDPLAALTDAQQLQLLKNSVDDDYLLKNNIGNAIARIDQRVAALTAAQLTPAQLAAALTTPLTDSLKAALSGSGAQVDADAIASKVVDDLLGHIKP